jgi:hypothetical protein
MPPDSFLVTKTYRSRYFFRKTSIAKYKAAAGSTSGWIPE